MVRVREDNKFYSEEEHKKLKQAQSENAVIIFFALYGAVNALINCD